MEFKIRETLKRKPVTDMFGFGSHNQPVGIWSDDTSLTIATMESIFRQKRIDYADLMNNFALWYFEGEFTARGEVFDCGGTTLSAIIKYVREKHLEDCGSEEIYSNGNGSLMRILPVAVYLYSVYGKNFDERAMLMIHEVSALTHAHPRSMVGCGIYSLIAVELLERKSIQEAIQIGLSNAEEYYSDSEFVDELEKYSRLWREDFANLPEEEIKSTGYVVDTLEAALWCLLNTKDYKTLVLKAVNLGDTEIYNFGQILDSIYGIDNRIAIVTVQHNPKGRNQAVFFSENVEYMLWYSNDIQNADFNDVAISDSVKETFTENDNGNKYRWESFVRAKNSRTKDKRPDNWYPLYVSKDLSTISSKWFEESIEVLPVVDSGEFTWKNVKSTFDELNRNGYFKAVQEKNRIAIYHRYYENQVLKNLWVEKKYQSEFNGTNLLKDIFGKADVFSYPKSLYTVSDSIKIALKQNETVIDYFAGSAITGHAVINLNREDDGNRKYILVEMGEYFDTVTKPRMQKVIYSADWKNGKPQNRNTGVSQIIKYMSLESYEDALSNIELSDKGNQWASFLGDEYIIRYMLAMESRDSLLNVEKFSNPFAYSMKITEKNECKSRPVDLIETFNYLIGLTVYRQSTISYYLSKPAKKPAYEGAVEFVSDIDGEYTFRDIEGFLPDGRRALVIWRTVTDNVIASNAALDAYFTINRKNAANREYDVIFVNGYSNLENLRGNSESWTVHMTEIEFKKRMFEET